MEVLEIKSSTAISQISFHNEDNLVGVSFTYNPQKEYLFICNELEDVKSQIQDAESTGSSIGKLIHSFRKDGTFVNYEINT